MKKMLGSASCLGFALLSIACLTLPNTSFGQAGFSGPSGSGLIPEDTPVNDGVVYLLIAGMIFGAISLYYKTVKKNLKREAIA